MRAIWMIILGISLGSAREVEFNPLSQYSIEQQQQQKQQEQQQEQNQQDRRKQELLSEDNLLKEIATKSVQDEEVIQAAQGYEFEQLPETSPDYSSSQVVEMEPISSFSYGDRDHHPKIGYSVGGPLVNIAQGAAAQAHTFEKSQPAAAAQAAYVAKNRLGQSAGLSAATAAAAFAGKQIILRGLEQQAYSAHRSLESEKLQLQQAQRAATAAAQAAQQAMHQVQVITTALNAAQTTSEHASAAAAASASELAAQTAMVGAAKARLQTIEDQLYHAHIDFEATQHANLKAAHAAQVAQNNAAAAAAHAAKIANNYQRHHHYKHDHSDYHHGQNDHKQNRNNINNHKHRHLKYHHHDNHEHHNNLKHEHNEQDQKDKHEHEHEHDHEHEHEHDQEHEQEHNHDRQESIVVPLSSSVSMTLSSTSLPFSVSSTLKDGQTRERSGRVLHSTSENFPSVMTTASSIGKDEIYDAYDSFPY